MEEAQLGASWACTEPLSLILLDPRGRVGQGQLERDRRGGLAPTCVWAASAGLPCLTLKMMCDALTQSGPESLWSPSGRQPIPIPPWIQMHCPDPRV